METEEEDLCRAAVLAFHSLAELAERLATGGAKETVVISDGVSRLAERAAAFAANNPPRPFLHSPDPLARLAGMVERLRELMPHTFAGDDSAYLKVRAGELAAKCRELSIIAGMRLASLLEKRQWEAETEARVAEAEAAIYEAQHKAEEAEVAKKREAEARARAEAIAEERGRMLNALVDKLEDKLENIESNTTATAAAVAGAGAKEAKVNALVGAFKRFFEEVGPDIKPGGKIALAHFQDFIADPKNKTALGRARAFRTFRRQYQEWIDLGRPDTGKDYFEKRARAKSQKRKMEAARR